MRKIFFLIPLLVLVFIIIFIGVYVLQPSKLIMPEAPSYTPTGTTDKYPEQKPQCTNVKTWAKVFGGPGFDYATSLQQTLDGGYIVTGFLNSGPTDSAGEKQYDVLLFKVDANGNKLWEKTYGENLWDASFSLQQTSDGGFIIGGGTRSFGGSDAYLIKTDAEGNLQWNKTFDLCRGNDEDIIMSVRQTSDGGYISAGWTMSCSKKLWGQSLPLDDSFLLKTDANGNKMWESIFGWEEGYDRALSVQQTSDGGYVSLGYVYYWVPGEVSRQDIYLVKTDTNGNILWNNTFAVGMDRAKTFQQTSDGGYVITGQGTDRRLYLLKTDSNGNKIWEKSFGDLNLHILGYSVKETADGGYFIIGARLIADYEPRTIIVDNNVILETPYEIYLLKTDADGNIVSETFDGRTFNGVLWPGQQTPDGGYIIVETVFPRVSATQYANTTDILMMKLNENGVVCNLTYGQPCTLVPEPQWINNPECKNLIYDEEYKHRPYFPE